MTRRSIRKLAFVVKYISSHLVLVTRKMMDYSILKGIQVSQKSSEKQMGLSDPRFLIAGGRRNGSLPGRPGTSRIFAFKILRIILLETVNSASRLSTTQHQHERNCTRHQRLSYSTTKHQHERDSFLVISRLVKAASYQWRS